MIFDYTTGAYPGGILQGDAIWQRLNSAFPWRSIEMTDRNLTRQADIAVLAYRASAERQDAPIYEALCTSTYLLDDKKWDGCPTSRPRFLEQLPLSREACSSFGIQV